MRRRGRAGGRGRMRSGICCGWRMRCRRTFIDGGCAGPCLMRWRWRYRRCWLCSAGSAGAGGNLRGRSGVCSGGGRRAGCSWRRRGRAGGGRRVRRGRRMCSRGRAGSSGRMRGGVSSGRRRRSRGCSRAGCSRRSRGCSRGSWRVGEKLSIKKKNTDI